MNSPSEPQSNPPSNPPSNPHGNDRAQNAYAPPTYGQDVLARPVPARFSSEPPRARSIVGLTAAVTATTAAWIAGTLAQVPLAFASAPVYQRYHESFWLGFTDATAAQDEPVTGYTTANALTGLVQVAVFVLTLVWLWRARANADVLAPGFRHRWSPVWTWLSWFVPFVNLAFPYQVMADVRRASAAAARRPLPGAPLGWWWGSYLSLAVVGTVPAALTTGFVPATSLGWWVLLQFVVTAATGLLLVQAVRGIADLQQHP